MLALTLVLALFAIATGITACVLFTRYMSQQSNLSFDDDEPVTRRKRRDAEESAHNAKKSLILIGVFGGSTVVLAVAVIVCAINIKQPADTRTATGVETAKGFQVEENGPFGKNPTAPAIRQYDAEGLPLGNDFDAVLFRLNARFRQGNTHLYGLEVSNMRHLKGLPGFARGRDAFLAFQALAGTPATPPPFIGMVSDAWREMLSYVTRAEVPELCQMLRTQPVESRQQDVLNKLAGFKDARCAEAVARFLAVPNLRGQAESLLRDLDSTAEKFVLPYLAATHHKDTRISAMAVLAEIGTAESARHIEPMTRDFALQNHAKNVFEKLAVKFGVGYDIVGVVASLKASVLAGEGHVSGRSAEQLDAMYHPDHPNRAAVFRELVDLCKSATEKKLIDKRPFTWAMKWASIDDLQTLCEMLVATGGEWAVFKKLQVLKDVRSAPTVAAFLTDPLKRTEVTDTLKAIGPAAMKAVAAYAVPAYPNGAEIDFFTRSAAIDMLGEIGTKECIPFLQQVGAELKYQGAAGKAINKILARGL